MVKRFTQLPVLLMICVLSLQLNAQDYTEISTNTLSVQNTINQSLNDFDLFTADFSELSSKSHDEESAAFFRLNVEAYSPIEFQVSPEDILSPSYKLRVMGNPANIPDIYTVIQGAESEFQLKRKKSIVFNGYMSDTRSGEVRLTVDGNFIFGSFKTDEGDFFIENAKRYDDNLPDNSYIIYQAGDIKVDPDVSCGVTEVKQKRNELEQGQSAEIQAGDCQLVELAVAHDIEMYQENNTSIRSTENHAIAVMNLVNGDYDDEFADEIRFEIVEQVVFVDYNQQPESITNSTTIFEALPAFRSEGPSIFNESYDLGQLWTGRNFSGGVIGLAYVGVVCEFSRYHVVENYSSNMQSLRVLTTHEIGHNFNCPHNYDQGSPCDPPGRPALIMDPVADPNATEWSDGTMDNCEANSVNSVNVHVDDKENVCLSSCNSQLEAEFYSDATTGCSGSTISFFDASLGDATSWSWSFPGGNPTSSTSQNPIVTYDTPGEYNVTLTINGSSTLTKNNYVKILTSNGADVCPITGGSPSGTGGFTLFQIQDASDNTLFSNSSSSPQAAGSIFTDFSCLDIPFLDAGSDYTFVINTVASQKLIFALDDNNDGTFEASEILFNIGVLGPGLYGASITIPASSVTGEYLKLRVWTSGSSGSDVCATPDMDGEVEDYAIVLNDSDFEISEEEGCSNLYTNNVSGSSYIPFYLGDRIVAELNPNGQNLGNVNLKVNDLSSVEQTSTGNFYIPRNWSFNSENDFSNDVSIRLYLLDDELDDYNTASGNNLNISDLEISWYEADNIDNEDCDFSNNNPDLGTRGVLSPVAVNYDQSPQSGFYLEFDIDHFTEFGAGEGDILPVRFLEFSLENNKNRVDLVWKTVDEVRNSHFVVQRSTDGQEFVDIGTVNAVENSFSVNSYAFTDKAPLKGKSYYRLRQVDIDGSDSYSVIRSAYNEFGSQSFSLYPNPAQSRNEIYISISQKGEYNLRIYNSDGKLMLANSLIQNSQQQQHPIDISELNKGVFFIEVSSSQVQWEEKFLNFK